MNATFTFANLIVVIGAYAYVAGWEYLFNLRHDVNVTAYAIQDIPLNQIYSASVVVFASHFQDICALLVAGVLIGTACVRLFEEHLPVVAIGCVIFFAMVSLTETTKFAMNSAQTYISQLMSSQTAPRVKFLLESSAKGHYDRAFIALNERLRLRLLEVAGDDVYVIRKQFLFPTPRPSATPKQETITYRVPKLDYSNVIFYKPPTTESSRFDLLLPDAIWEKLKRCQGSPFIVQNKSLRYAIDGDGETLRFSGSPSMTKDELAQAFFEMPVKSAAALNGLVSDPRGAYALFTDVRIMLSGVGCATRREPIRPA